MDIYAFFTNYELRNNVKVVWFISALPEKNSKALTVSLSRGEIKVNSIFLFPMEGSIDLVHLNDRLEVLLNEIEREEARNGKAN